MGLSVTEISASTVGDRRRLVVDITFDASYPTGGEPVDAGVFGLTTVEEVDAATDGTRLFVHDTANQKLMVFTGLGTQAANATDLSAVVARAVIVGF